MGPQDLQGDRRSWLILNQSVFSTEKEKKDRDCRAKDIIVGLLNSDVLSEATGREHVLSHKRNSPKEIERKEKRKQWGMEVRGKRIMRHAQAPLKKRENQ